jgi:CHAT domain-containing protein
MDRSEQNCEKQCTGNFLELLQSVINSNGDGQIVYQFFDEHIAYLDERLLVTLPKIVKMLLERVKDPALKSGIQSTLNSLTIYLCQFSRGNRSLNLELAIACCDATLLEYKREYFPLEWAMTQMNRANAYSARIEGERRANLEEAIRGYDAALSEVNRDYLPLEWAMTQMNRAKAYSDRIEGERRASLEEAIRGYDDALLEYTHARFPLEWASTQINRATAYWNRIEGDRRANLEEAIRGYDDALLECTRECSPREWASNQMNRALAYRDRIEGERRVNLEEAIQSCDDALLEYTHARFPLNWARTQMNRATAYRDRIEGDRRENLEESIRGYDQALLECTRDKLPIEWAMIQMCRANTYCGRIEGDRLINLEEAIRGYDAALLEYKRECLPLEWAMTQMNRANAYRDRIEGERRVNLEEAIRGYDAALLEYKRECLPLDWAMTNANLAIVYTGNNDELAIYLYHQILAVFTPENLPIDALKASHGLANIYFRQGSWKSAIDAYETAMQAVETSRSWVVNEQIRQQLLNDALAVYENAIQCAINIGNYPQAIQYTERIRSRQLVDLMGTKDLYPDAEIPADIQKYLDEYEQLNRQIHHLREHGSPDSDGTTKSTRNAASLSRDDIAIQALEKQKRAQYLKIRAFDPAIAGQIAVEPIDFTAIQKLITTPHTAILTCYTTDNATHIFIIKQGQQPTLHTCTNQGWSELQQWLQTEWVIPYHTNNSTWQQNLPTLLTEISQRLQLDTLIEEHLTDITELIIVPHLNLHQIPFAALPINPTQNEASGSFLGDKFIIRSIPSCQILQYCQQRKPITTKHIGTVEDAEDNLLGARYEGEQIAALYSIPTANRLRGSTQATVANYRELLTRVNRLHSSHHAISRPDNPIESALILANGERITLGDLLLGKRYRDTLDEVFLSACETHVGTATLTDDVATLTTGFLCIGARSVQSTLWSVDDLVTALFDIFYHQERRDDRSRAFSLRAAQFRLRNFSGSEFKLRFYDELSEHFNKNSPAMITDLKQQCKKLNAQQSTLNNDTEEWQKLAETMKSLIRIIKSIESIPAVLNGYCATDRPFAKPYYWAAFITQGMA